MGIDGGDLLSYRQVALSTTLPRWKGEGPTAFPGSLAVSCFPRGGLCVLEYELEAMYRQRSWEGLGSTGRPFCWSIEIPPSARRRWWTHGALLFLSSSPEGEAWHWGVGRLGNSGFVPVCGTGETLEPTRDSPGIPRTRGFVSPHLLTE